MKSDVSGTYPVAEFQKYTGFEEPHFMTQMANNILMLNDVTDNMFTEM